MRAAFGTLFYAALPLLGKRSYDIIHGHFGPNGLKAAFLLEAGLLRGKLITTFHGYDVNVFPRRYGFSVYRRLFIRGDFYTANTSFTTGRAIDLGCPPERIVTLPVGVSLAKFPFAERKLERTGEIRILTVGTLIEVKGIEFGIRAVARLAHRRPMIRYQIVGDGPLLRPLGELARKLAIADRVEFLGALPEDQLRECYRQTHIFMLPGVIARSGAQEGQGLVLVEAQASGIPVIATRVGGIPQTVLDGDSAFLVPQRDVDALASKIRYLIEHPQRWPEIGRAGRRHVERHFDIEKLNDRLVDIYRKVLDETPL